MSAKKITRVIVESGSLETTNVPIPVSPQGEKATETWSGDLTIQGAEVTLPDRAAKGNRSAEVVAVLAPEVVLAEAGDHQIRGRSGAGGLEAGSEGPCQRRSGDLRSREIQPGHAKWITRSDKAKPMAVNIYSGFWTLVVSLVTTIGVSLFTRPRRIRN